MKIGLVNAMGLNSADAMLEMELCLLLQKSGMEVIPIIQSEIGSAAIVNGDFSCIVADMTVEEDASRALSEMDMVILIKEATPRAPHGQPDMAREMNKNLVNNLVKYSKRSSVIIYISSISSLGKKLSKKYEKDSLVREKLFVEKRLLKKGLRWNRKYKNQKKIYVFRVGHVMGNMQKQTRDLQNMLNKGGEIYVDADGDLESNVVHIEHIVRAIQTCKNGKTNPGIYTVVNSPQWSWKEVIEYYAPKESLVQFYGSSGNNKKSIVDRIWSIAWRVARTQKDRLVPLLTYMSEERNMQVVNKHLRGESKDAIKNLRKKAGIQLDIFSYSPARGKMIPKIELEEMEEE